MESLRKRTLTIQLEEKRPSEMLAALHEHTKDMKVEEEVPRHIWLEKLPLDLRHSLALSEKYLCLIQEVFGADIMQEQYIGYCKGTLRGHSGGEAARDNVSHQMVLQLTERWQSLLYGEGELSR